MSCAMEYTLMGGWKAIVSRDAARRCAPHVATRAAGCAMLTRWRCHAHHRLNKEENDTALPGEACTFVVRCVLNILQVRTCAARRRGCPIQTVSQGDAAAHSYACCTRRRSPCGSGPSMGVVRRRSAAVLTCTADCAPLLRYTRASASRLPAPSQVRTTV